MPFRNTTPQAAAAGEAATWALYDRINASTLLVRGAESDLLTPRDGGRDGGSGPRPQVAEVAMSAMRRPSCCRNEIKLVRDFLLEGVG